MKLGEAAAQLDGAADGEDDVRQVDRQEDQGTPLLKFAYTFLLLMIYSVLGWCSEMIYCSAGQRKLCEKRGFLNGPICPIYGHGALVVLLCLDGGCKNPLLTFLLGAVLTTLYAFV